MQRIVSAAAELREADTGDTAKINEALGQIQNAPYILARRNRETDVTASAPTHGVFGAILKPRTSLDRNLLDRPTHSHLSFDFTWDAVTLQTFCKHIEPICRRQGQHIAIEYIFSRALDVLNPPMTLGTHLSEKVPNLR